MVYQKGGCRLIGQTDKAVDNDQMYDMMLANFYQVTFSEIYACFTLGTDKLRSWRTIPMR